MGDDVFDIMFDIVTVMSHVNMLLFIFGQLWPFACLAQEPAQLERGPTNPPARGTRPGAGAQGGSCHTGSNQESGGERHGQDQKAVANQRGPNPGDSERCEVPQGSPSEPHSTTHIIMFWLICAHSILGPPQKMDLLRVYLVSHFVEERISVCGRVDATKLQDRVHFRER